MLDGCSTRSCLTLAVQADGADVETIEGLTERGIIADLQHEFVARNALQCGYCTPGILVTAAELLCRPTLSPVRDPRRARCSKAIFAAAPAIRRSSRPSRRWRTEGARRECGSLDRCTVSAPRGRAACWPPAKARYTDDIAANAAQVAFLLRSPHAHARIDRIDVGAAQSARRA